MHEAIIRVFYPLHHGELILRTEQDWDRDIEPESVDPLHNCFDFRIKNEKSLLCFKPCIREGGSVFWAGGANRVALLDKNFPQDIYPYFYSSAGGGITYINEVPSKLYKSSRKLRLYLPAGYSENTLKRYPVIYMQDGKNLFFPEEAFLGQEWHMDENLDLLNTMNLTEQIIVVGIYAENRDREYTSPGYHRFGRSIVEEIKPWIDTHYRTLTAPWHTAVLGSSLGGVVSFYLGWEWPHIFSAVACMSSTFSWKDNLIDRVEHDDMEPRKNLKIYLDTGWPGDNYDETVKMGNALLERGFKMGLDFLHLAFPLARHNEDDWASRVHIPIQMFFGRIRRAMMRTLHPLTLMADYSIQPSEQKCISKMVKSVSTTESDIIITSPEEGGKAPVIKGKGRKTGKSSSAAKRKAQK
ncbi:MAG: alpha/beta hydrolase [Candidatus Xenobiia bacterium LiM19]